MEFIRIITQRKRMTPKDYKSVEEPLIIYQIQHPDGEWIDCSKECFNGVSGINRRVLKVNLNES